MCTEPTGAHLDEVLHAAQGGLQHFLFLLVALVFGARLSLLDTPLCHGACLLVPPHEGLGLNKRMWGGHTHSGQSSYQVSQIPHGCGPLKSDPKLVGETASQSPAVVLGTAI